MRTCSTIAAIGLILAVSPVLAGCQGSQGGRPVPATFGPSPFGPSQCPPGWHETSDGGCLITGTLKPGQQLPLPVISGTRLPMPVQLPSPDGTPGATLAASRGPR